MLAAAVLAQVNFTVVFSVVPVLAPAIRTRYVLSLSQLGAVLAAPGVGVALTIFLWGALSDRWGDRLVVSVGLGGAAAALALGAAAPGVAVLELSLAGGAALVGAVIPGGGRAVLVAFAPEERGLALAIRHTGAPLGGMLAAIFVPVVLGAGGLGAAFFAVACSCALAAVVAALCVPAPRAAPREEPNAVEPPAAHPLRDGRVWRLSVASALLYPAQTATVGFAVLFLHQHDGLSVARGGAVLAGIQTIGGAIRLASGRWSDRVGSRLIPLRRIAAASVVGLVSLAVLADAPASVAMVVLLVAGGLSIGWNALAFTAIAESTGPDRSGAALGIQQTLMSVASAAAPVALASIVGAGSWRAAYLTAAACPAAAQLLLRDVAVPCVAAPEPGD